MKKLILTLLFLVTLITQSYAQIVFKPGYFVNESNERIDCLIKDVGWKNNPDKIEYKLSEDSTEKTVGIESIIEFSIDGDSKYIRAKVKIDKSSDALRDITHGRNPVFQDEVLFLKVLIEGEASLYMYVEGTLNRYFYKQHDSDINQLVYKRYLVNDSDIMDNNLFRQQLFTDLKCQGIDSNSIERLKYNNKDLERFFILYNECVNSQFIVYKSTSNEDWFSLSLKPGFNYESIFIKNSFTDVLTFDFENELNFRFGIEAEFFLPFNKKKLSVIVEPTFHDFKTEKEAEGRNLLVGLGYSKANYRSIEVPVGIRYHFYIKNSSQIFLNVSSILFDISKNASIDIIRSDGSTLTSLEFVSGTNIAIGIGYKYKDKYSLEARYQPYRDIIRDYEKWSSQYKGLSVMFGYSLF